MHRKHGNIMEHLDLCWIREVAYTSTKLLSVHVRSFCRSMWETRSESAHGHCLVGFVFKHEFIHSERVACPYCTKMWHCTPFGVSVISPNEMFWNHLKIQSFTLPVNLSLVKELNPCRHDGVLSVTDYGKWNWNLRGGCIYSRTLKYLFVASLFSDSYLQHYLNRLCIIVKIYILL